MNTFTIKLDTATVKALLKFLQHYSMHPLMRELYVQFSQQWNEKAKTTTE